MQLKIYKKQDIQKPFVRQRPCKIRITANTVSLSKSVCEALCINENDKIIFCQDEKNAQDWYIGTHPEGIELRKNEKTAAVMFNGSALCQEFLKSLNLKESVSFLVSTTPVSFHQGKGLPSLELYPIITANPIK